MSIAITYSRAQVGIQAPLVTIEVHISRGLPSISIVGLPEAAVKESKDRVRSAILNNHFEFPLGRITINLAPADLPKDGARFDLAIAMGILAASGQIPKESLNQYEFSGELALTGELRAVKGMLPFAHACSQQKHKLVLPGSNADEAALVSDVEIYPAMHLMEVCSHIHGNEQLPLHTGKPIVEDIHSDFDFSDVRAQNHAKRALEVAAAGGHNLIMIGPPGTGKTMLAERLPGILPPMTESQALESAAVTSISTQGFDPKTWKQRPIRHPHHTASGVALVGGGSHPRPGEISLAHHGVLFLDELPEFDRRVLEVLREPLESGRIVISRAANQAEFPAQFQLIAAMNPCPCGYLGDTDGRCHCTEDQVRRYRQKISGPLLDRIDIHIEVAKVAKEVFQQNQSSNTEDSRTVQRRVAIAYQLQLDRAGKSNHKLTNKEVNKHCKIDNAGSQLLDTAITRLGLSARAIHRILKVARTIADLADAVSIDATHLSEAISYRRLDRKNLV